MKKTLMISVAVISLAFCKKDDSTAIAETKKMMQDMTSTFSILAAGLEKAKNGKEAAKVLDIAAIRLKELSGRQKEIAIKYPDIQKQMQGNQPEFKETISSLQGAMKRQTEVLTKVQDKFGKDAEFLAALQKMRASLAGR